MLVKYEKRTRRKKNIEGAQIPGSHSSSLELVVVVDAFEALRWILKVVVVQRASCRVFKRVGVVVPWCCSMSNLVKISLAKQNVPLGPLSIQALPVLLKRRHNLNKTKNIS
jgi:hypothetical protein